MSSLEIAEVVEKRHDNVKRTINYLESVDAIESPHREEISTATRPRIEYFVNQRDSYVIVAQLSPEFTALLWTGKVSK
ncbi:Rha family transcriptional regulator [Vreelandella indica]|uniref:Rha family transcriptional regulator n=1 Tax=Vreelandella indica TaxID=3126500 RepID=UPI00300E0614